MNEWFLLSCCGKAGTDSIIVLGDLYTDDQEQGGKQSISRLPKIKSVPGVLRPCPSDCCLTHNGLHSKETLVMLVFPHQALKPVKSPVENPNLACYTDFGDSLYAAQSCYSSSQFLKRRTQIQGELSDLFPNFVCKILKGYTIHSDNVKKPQHQVLQVLLSFI